MMYVGLGCALLVCLFNLIRLAFDEATSKWDITNLLTLSIMWTLCELEILHLKGLI